MIDLRLTQLDCTNDGIEFLDRLRSEGLGFDGNSNPFIISLMISMILKKCPFYL